MRTILLIIFWIQAISEVCRFALLVAGSYPREVTKSEDAISFPCNVAVTIAIAWVLWK